MSYSGLLFRALWLAIKKITFWSRLFLTDPCERLKPYALVSIHWYVSPLDLLHKLASHSVSCENFAVFFGWGRGDGCDHSRDYEGHGCGGQDLGGD